MVVGAELGETITFYAATVFALSYASSVGLDRTRVPTLCDDEAVAERLAYHPCGQAGPRGVGARVHGGVPAPSARSKYSRVGLLSLGRE